MPCHKTVKFVCKYVCVCVSVCECIYVRTCAHMDETTEAM